MNNTSLKIAHKNPASKRLCQGMTLLELVVVLFVVAVVMAVGTRYYASLAHQSKISALQLLSNRFSASVSNLHLNWILKKTSAHSNVDIKSTVQAGGDHDFSESSVKYNSQGWPLIESYGKNFDEANKKYISNGDASKKLQDCNALWNLLLTSARNESGEKFQLPMVQPWAKPLANQRCQYGIQRLDAGRYFFVYDAGNGEVILSVSERGE